MVKIFLNSNNLNLINSYKGKIVKFHVCGLESVTVMAKILKVSKCGFNISGIKVNIVEDNLEESALSNEATYFIPSLDTVKIGEEEYI